MTRCTNRESAYDELPRLTEKALSQMNPVEAWFHILKRSATFTGVPEGFDPRLEPVMEAARSKRLTPEERLQYFRSMVSEEDKRDIAQAYLERGIEQGLEQGGESALNWPHFLFLSSDTEMQSEG